MGLLASLLAATIAVTAATAGCSQPTPGQAQPAPEATGQRPTTNPESTRNTPPPTTRPAGSPLADIEPCSLLTAQETTQLGVERGKREDVGTARACTWNGRDSAGNLLIYSVGLRENAGLGDFPPEKKVDQLPNVGRHEAVQTGLGGGAGTCTVALGVTDKSRVDMVTVAGTDQQKACDMALQLARLIEPKLP